MSALAKPLAFPLRRAEPARAQERRRGSIDSLKTVPVSSPTMQGIVVITTVGTEDQANSISRELVARRQAACVNILPGVRSVYRWQGKICQDGEWLLVIKSCASEFEAVRTTIRELHDYELPEILAFQVSLGDEGFLEWMSACLDKSADFSDDDEEDDDDERRSYADLADLDF